ncbi:nuclear transport factor 2 family protein [Mucilaginibacter sp.]|uniref:YybH family protein n=1 Tax=Mucilaginibacter sp. TaxID=1882438 RepID=UPI0025E4E28D|nr:nuclear transport factor 2 family protein [Mucilaginibacter sp.]
MTINNKPFARQAVLMLCLLVASIGAKAQSAEKEIIDAMNNSALEWNKGHLDTFVSLYDPSATMMYPTGPVGMTGITDLYKKSYFKPDGMPKQNLRYFDLKVRMLGTDYALVTGGFTLYGNNLPERSGRYSLVCIHTKTGWKILHDHSS